MGWQGAGGGTGPCCARMGSGGSQQALGKRGARCLSQGGHQQSGHPVAPSLLPEGYGHLQHPRVCQGHLHALSQHRAAEKPRWEASPRGTWLYRAAPRSWAAAGCWCQSAPTPASSGSCSQARRSHPLLLSPRKALASDPFPQIHRQSDSLTGMQRTSGQTRNTISVTGLCMRWTHRAQEGMTHRCSTVKSLEKLA